MDQTLLAKPQPPRFRSLLRRLITVSIGGFLEWFDFSIYAVFAVIISEQIFGSIGAIFLVFLAYGLGFVMRPAGSFFFGHIGDKYGRKRALTITFWVMGLATIITGLVPGYAKIGISAPILLTAVRMAQGFGAGGEWGSAGAYLIELGGSTRRGFFSSIQNFVALFGIMVSTAVGLALTQLPSAFLDSVGWRLPFLIGGLVIIPIAFFSRKEMPETDCFEQMTAKNEIKTSPILMTLKNDYKPFMIIIFGTAALMTTFYGAIIYMATYIVTFTGLSLEVGLIASLTSLAFMTFLTPAFGYLSDILKTRKRLFLISTLMMIPLTPIYFLTVATHQLDLIVVMAAIFGAAVSAAAGTLVAFVSESFPTSERVTGFASYNISAAYFGGFAPVIFITLIGLLNTKVAPAYYAMAVAIMSATALYYARDTGKLDELPQNESLYSKK